MMFKRITEFLDKNEVEYETFTHDHVHSSQDAAKVRGTKLEEAAKALILQTKSGVIFQCVVSGHRKLDLKKIKEIMGEKNLSLAHPDVVHDETGCKVGTVPPFANLFTPPLRMLADQDIFSREHVVFSAGTHHDSIRMKAQDWLSITQAEKLDIGKE